MRKSRFTLHGRMRHESADAEREDGDTEFVEIEARELSGIFASPTWLRDLGVMAWLLVGVALLSRARSGCFAHADDRDPGGRGGDPGLGAVAAHPPAEASRRAAWGRRRDRAAADRARGRRVAWLVIRGISAQSGELNSQLQGAATKVEGWLKDLGVTRRRRPTPSRTRAARSATPSTSCSAGSARAEGAGLARGVPLLHGPEPVLPAQGRAGDPAGSSATWACRGPVARTISARTIGSMQGYFVGVTAVAAFNGIVVGLGALVLGVPLAGSIAVINFVAAYIPYLGAWTAGAFTVLVALGDGGPSTALAMGVISLLANGALQQLIQPIAYGAALGIHPLAVLIVTIAGGALFGTIGLIVAAPLTSAVTKIARDLAVARSAEEDAAATSPPSSPAAPAPT